MSYKHKILPELTLKISQCQILNFLYSQRVSSMTRAMSRAKEPFGTGVVMWLAVLCFWGLDVMRLCSSPYAY